MKSSQGPFVLLILLLLAGAVGWSISLDVEWRPDVFRLELDAGGGRLRR